MRRNSELSRRREDGDKDLERAAKVARVRPVQRALATFLFLALLGIVAYVNTGQVLALNTTSTSGGNLSVANAQDLSSRDISLVKRHGSVVENNATYASYATTNTKSESASTSGLKPFAYMFYITKDIYACAALHLITQLVQNLHMNTSAIDIVVLHSNALSQTMQNQLQQHLPVRLIKVDPINADATEPTWKESLTKLLVVRDWGYDRVVYLDADSVPMQNLDHLFALPPAPLYAPIAYWLPQPFFSSILMVIEPSTSRFEAMIQWARSQGAAAGFDMDILNSYFKDTVQYLPGDYTVLNSDFRAKPDAKNPLYATTTELKKHVKLIHFSCKPDGSYGKPWTSASRDVSFVASQGLDPLFADLFVGFWATQDNRCS